MKFEDLDVWKLSARLSPEIYKELFELKAKQTVPAPHLQVTWERKKIDHGAHRPHRIFKDKTKNH